MKTVGNLLKSAREKHQLTLDQIAAHTKISKKYLIAIEDNDFHQLPPAAFSKGFLHTYAAIVGVDPKMVLAIFRRDFDQDSKGRIIPRSLIDPIKQAPAGLTPNRLGLIFTIAGSLLVAGFFLIQIISFSAKPPLSLDEPSDKAVLVSPVIVRGKTSPQSVVTVNNKNVLVSATGDFTTQLDLTPGEHTLIIASESRNNKKTVAERIIYIETLPEN
jgi:cytoskeletal protein RodZ